MASKRSIHRVPYPGFSRRQFLNWSGRAGLGLGIGLALHSCSSTSPVVGVTSRGRKPYEGQTLRVFIYAGTYEKVFNDTIVPGFEQLTGAKLIIDPGWWDSVPKLKLSPPDQPAFDLVLTDATQGFPAVKEGLYQQLNLASIPNVQRLGAKFLDTWIYRDRYGITFPDSIMTLAYNKQLIQEPLTSWGDLMKEEFRGKIGFYDSFYMSLYTFAAMKVAQAGKAGTAAEEMDKNLQGVIDFAKENRDRIKYWWPTSTDMTINLIQKNCEIGNMHSPDYLPAMSEKPELGAIVPEADRAFVLLFWAIPAATKKKELAQEAINFILSDEMQLALARGGFMTASLPAIEKAAAESPLWKQVYPSTEKQLQALSYYPYDAYFKAWDDIVHIWDREILRKA